jgi:aspartyl-tRNA(Asn)/glutamyl-tRNA(Gln) amidotransferase subunit A
MILTPLRAVDQLNRCLAEIDHWNPSVNAMITVDASGAMAAAQAADHARSLGNYLGPLHGVPIAVKDNLDTAGLRTTYGSGFFNDHIPQRDATVVSRLRKAGAVIVGKCTLHEFAFGVRSNNPVIGQCKNPWDTTKIPGGSSGGSGVAVATGMAQMALGTDTGGSVRIPAALNGVTGLRPTLGRVPNTGCMPVSETHDTVGPLARTAYEAAVLFSVIAGFDPLDPISENTQLPNFLSQLSGDIAGIRIGKPRNHYFDGLEPDVALAIERSIEELKSLGAVIVDVEVPGAELAHLSATHMIYSDACATHEHRLLKGGDEWSAQTLERMRMGLAYDGMQYARAMRHREAWCRQMQNLFNKVDILLSPTTLTTAPLIDDHRNLYEATRAVTANTYAGAFAKLPGISVPCGYSSSGLPIGLMLEAAMWQEPLLFKVACAYQSITDWHMRHPPKITTIRS